VMDWSPFKWPTAAHFFASLLDGEKSAGHE
jgi:hypothetical protein